MHKLIYTLVVFFIFSFFQLRANPNLDETDSMMITTSDHVKLFVKIKGKGTPCVFLHGGPGSWSYYFEGLGGNVVEKDVQMIYLDQRGCGRSEADPAGDYSIKRLEKDLEEIRTKLGIKKWIVMAHSFGGILAVNYAKDYPKSLVSLMMLNCTINVQNSVEQAVDFASGILGKPKSEFQGSNPMETIGNVFWKLGEKNLAYKMMYRSIAEKQREESLMSSYKINRDYAMNVGNFKEYLLDYFPVTAKVKVPVFILAGSEDYSVGPKHHENMKFPNAEVTVMEGGHALYQEYTEAFYNVLHPFLVKHK